MIAWQKAQDLAVQVYQQFSTLNDFGFKDQIFRASISISNNIAEGFDRQSNKDFIRFLFFAKSSTGEVKSMLYIAERVGYCEKSKALKMREQCEEISKIIRGLMKSLSR